LLSDVARSARNAAVKVSTKGSFRDRKRARGGANRRILAISIRRNSFKYLRREIYRKELEKKGKNA